MYLLTYIKPIKLNFRLQRVFKRPSLPLFRLFFVFSNKLITILEQIQWGKWSIKYPAQGFELKTSWSPFITTWPNVVVYTLLIYYKCTLWVELKFKIVACVWNWSKTSVTFFLLDDQFSYKSCPNTMIIFGLFYVQNDLTTFWAILGKIGQLVTPSSGHTVYNLHPPKIMLWIFQRQLNNGHKCCCLFILLGFSMHIFRQSTLCEIDWLTFFTQSCLYLSRWIIKNCIQRHETALR